MSTYPRHKFTGAVAYRIDALYCAAGYLDCRAELYSRLNRTARSLRALKAANRLRMRAYGLMVRALSPAELVRLDQIAKAKHAEAQARRKAA